MSGGEDGEDAPPFENPKILSIFHQPSAPPITRNKIRRNATMHTLNQIFDFAEHTKAIVFMFLCLKALQKKIIKSGQINIVNSIIIVIEIIMTLVHFHFLSFFSTFYFLCTFFFK